MKVEEQFILEEDILRVKISVKNTNAYPFYFKREDFSFFVPFADSYDGSLVSQAVRCHTHIAAFLENSWMQAERMGFSEYNLGVLLLKGSTYSYSQENCTHSNDRGYLSLNVSPERVNGKKCAFFDPFANEQDGFLYLAYKMAEDLEYSE